MAKKKPWLDYLYALVRAFTTNWTAFWLSYFAFISCFISPAPFLSCFKSSICLLPLFACPKTHITLSSRFISALIPKSLPVLSSFLVLSLISSYLALTALKTFKQALSHEFLWHLTGFEKFFYLFPPFSLLLNKINCNLIFYIIFINFCLLADNHIQKEVDLSLAK